MTVNHPTLRSMNHEQLVHECAYRGAELVIALKRIEILERRRQPDIDALWQHHIDRDDRNSPEEYPEMALITFDEFRDAILSRGVGQ